MTVHRLLRFYPRAWRERYGPEFADLVGSQPLTVQQQIDILAGAVDAWISPSVRASVRGAAVGTKTRGDMMIQQLKLRCATTGPRYTAKDGLIGAGVMIGATIVLTAVGFWAKQAGYVDLGKALMGISFPVSLSLSMPFWLTKGQSPTVQAIFVGTTIVFLVLSGFLSIKI